MSGQASEYGADLPHSSSTEHTGARGRSGARRGLAGAGASGIRQPSLGPLIATCSKGEKPKQDCQETPHGDIRNQAIWRSGFSVSCLLP